MQRSFTKHTFVGVDTHKDDHTTCITNCWRQILGNLKVENHSASFGKFLHEVEEAVPEELTPVFGLEDTDGLGRSLAQFLLESTHIAGEVNPAKVERKREKAPHSDNLSLRCFLYLQSCDRWVLFSSRCKRKWFHGGDKRFGRPSG